MFLSSIVSADLGLMDAGIIALLGYAVVFFGLILLMIVIMALGKVFTRSSATAKAPAKKDHPAPVVEQPAPTVVPTAAPGSAGQLKLYDTPPKTAAMLMAIVADKMGKPLNELRFLSIKEVK